MLYHFHWVKVRTELERNLLLLYMLYFIISLLMRAPQQTLPQHLPSPEARIESKKQREKNQGGERL